MLNFNTIFLSKLYYTGSQKRGGFRVYSTKMYEQLLTLKVMLQLPWRATVVFARKLLAKLFGFPVPIPNYPQVNREAKKLNLQTKH